MYKSYIILTIAVILVALTINVLSGCVTTETKPHHEDRFHD